jgi:hypothetical protein
LPLALPLLERLPPIATKAALLGTVCGMAPATSVPLAIAHTVDVLRDETAGWNEFVYLVEMLLASIGLDAVPAHQPSRLDDLGRLSMDFGGALPAACAKAALDAGEARGLRIGPNLAMMALITLPGLALGTPLISAGATLRLAGRILGAPPLRG